MFTIGNSGRVVAFHFVEKVEKSASKRMQNVQNPPRFSAANEGFAPKTEDLTARNKDDRFVFLPGFTEEKVAPGLKNQSDGALQNLKNTQKTRGFERMGAGARINSLRTDRARVLGRGNSAKGWSFHE